MQLKSNLTLEKILCLTTFTQTYTIEHMRLFNISTSTLYVSRPLVNAQDLYNWAKQQGFPDILDPQHMHATIAYSRKSFDISVIDQRVSKELHAQYEHDRHVQSLGNSGAVVLMFGSDDLHARWQHICDCGASWDYQQYQPHVTITYNSVPSGLDISAVDPFADTLVFGPEHWEPLDESWTTSDEK